MNCKKCIKSTRIRIGVTVGLVVAVALSVTALADTTPERTTPFVASQSAIAAYYNQQIADLQYATDSFATDAVITAPYASARLSDETMLDALNMINYIRFVAGLPFDVTLNESYNSLAADAALVNLVNNTMSHYPAQPMGMDASLYASAYTGASQSNLSNAWSTNSSFNRNFYTKIVNGWMADEGVTNVASLGHRRWILNPTMSETGFGSAESRVSGFKQQSSMYVYDGAGEVTDMTAVIWPAANMPTNLFRDNYPWSYTVGAEVYGDVTVTMIRRNDGETWVMGAGGNDSTHFYVNNNYYGQPGCIIFVPSNISYSAGDIYDVVITGAVQDSYTVNFFDVTSVNADPNLVFETATMPSATYVAGNSNTAVG